MTASAGAFEVAIVCPSVGQTRRGYERFITGLFEHLKPMGGVTLFKGAGESQPTERVIPHLRRNSWFGRFRPELLRYPRYHLEYASFAAGLFPHLVSGRFSVVHFIDPPLGRLLHLTRSLTKRPFRTLFTNAAPSSYGALHWSDHVHCFSPDFIQSAIFTGYPEQRLSLLPVGLDMTAIRTGLSRAELRTREGIGEDTLVLLSVTSLNRHHKRVDYLIDEVAALKGNVLLWIDGSHVPDGDAALVQHAEAKLGKRFRYSHFRSDRVSELFQLADVFVSSALFESFGLSIVEAMACGLPAVVHDSPHFHWLTAEQGIFVNLAGEGALTNCLEGLMRCGVKRYSTDAVCSRYRWETIAPQFYDLYARLMREGACS